MLGLMAQSLHMIVLDEVLELHLSNFSRQKKMKPEINDDQKIIVDSQMIFGFEMTRPMKKHPRVGTPNRRKLNWKR